MSASAKVLLYKSKNKKDGSHPIVVRVIKNRKPKYIFIGWIKEKDWDEKNLRVKSSHPNSLRFNNLILKKLMEASDLLLESEAQKNDFTAGQITKIIKGKRKEMTFLQLADEYVSDLRKTGKHTRASADGARLDVIKEFVNGTDITFREIDEPLLRRLRIYLLSEREISERTVMNYYVIVRTLFNLAIQEGIIEQKFYPFGKGKVRIKFPESLKVGLNEDEIKGIENLDLQKGTSIWHTRNVFLFSFYLAGIRISDVLRMKWSDIKDDRLYYRMGKNSKVDSLKMPDKVKDIIECYRDEKKSENDFIFPELRKANLDDTRDIHMKIRTATKKFNDFLSQIAKLAGINKKITNHISRHSFGNIAGDKVSPQMLQKLYRHTSLITTIGYQGNFIHKTADEALNTVVNF